MCIHGILLPGVTQILLGSGELRAWVDLLSQPDSNHLSLPGLHSLPLMQGFLVYSRRVLTLFLKLKIQELILRKTVGTRYGVSSRKCLCDKGKCGWTVFPPGPFPAHTKPSVHNLTLGHRGYRKQCWLPTFSCSLHPSCARRFWR
jgi:hypothetical protein